MLFERVTVVDGEPPLVAMGWFAKRSSPASTLYGPNRRRYATIRPAWLL